MESLFFQAVRQATKCMTTETDASLSKQQIVLLRVVELHKTLTVTELANVLGLSTSATTVAVNRMVECGMLKRKRDESDRRIVRIELAEKAQKVVDQLKEARCRFFLEMFSRLDSQEAEQFFTLLRKMLSKS